MKLGMQLMEHYNLSASDLPEHYGLIRLSGYQFHPVWQVISEAQLNTIKQYKALHRLGEGDKIPVISLVSSYQLEMLNPVPEDEFLSYIKRKLEKWNST